MKIAGVNVMAMDYGDVRPQSPRGQWHRYAIAAATSSLHTQLQPGCTARASPSSQLWPMIGVTPMIGVNDITTEVFDLAAASSS